MESKVVASGRVTSGRAIDDVYCVVQVEEWGECVEFAYSPAAFPAYSLRYVYVATAAETVLYFFLRDAFRFHLVSDPSRYSCGRLAHVCIHIHIS